MPKNRKEELDKALDQLISVAEERGYHGDLSSTENEHIIALKNELDNKVKRARGRVVSIVMGEDDAEE